MKLSLKKMLSAGIAFAAVFTAVSANAEDAKVQQKKYTWVTAPMGAGGFVDGFVYHPTEKGLLYARTDVLGAYRWDGETRSWIPLQDMVDNADDYGVLSMALDPQNPNKVYLATGLYTGEWAGNGKVWRSNDRGNTWETTKLNVKIGGNEDGRGTGERMQVDPNSSDILLLGTTKDGLLKSTDGAKTWSNVSSFPSKNINFVIFDPKSGVKGSATKTIYIGTNDKQNNLFVSHDAGDSWKLMEGTPKDFVAINVAFDGSGKSLYVTFSNDFGPNGCSNGAIYKHDIDKNTWKNISPEKPGNGKPNFCYAGVSTSPSAPGTVIVSAADRWWGGDTVYRSKDGGNNWVDLATLSKHHSEQFPWMIAFSEWQERMGTWIWDVEINPSDPDEAVYGTGAGLWMTHNLTQADKKQTVDWSFDVENLEETAIMDMVSPPAGAHLIVSVGDVGGFRFNDFEKSPPLDGGYYWPPAGSNYSVDYAELNPGLVVRTVNNDSAKTHAYYSINNGKTWIDMPTSPPMVTHNEKGWFGPGRIALSAKGTSMVWSTGNGEVYYSTDRGKSWIPSKGYNQLNGRYLQPFADRTVDGVYYAYDRDRGEMLASADNGANFQVVAKDLPKLDGWKADVIPRVVPGRVRDIWLPGPWGLLHARDAKSNFKPINGFTEVSGVGFGKAAEGSDYPTIFTWGKYNGKLGIYRSTDEGKSWIRINDDEHQYGPGSILIGDPRVFGLVYIAGRGVVVGVPE